MITTKRLSSGRYVDLGNLKTEDINIKDINTSLNYIYRFTGHSKDKEPLTVAQHTQLAVFLSRRLFPDDLVTEFDVTIHDFPEAYTGDIATPLKQLFGKEYKQYEEDIEAVVYAKLWTPVTAFNHEIYEKRKVCDLLALDIERRNIWNSNYGKNEWPEIPFEGIFSSKEKKELFDTIQKNRFVDLESMYNRIVLACKERGI